MPAHPRRPAAIFDVDGTLADVSAIRHFVDGPERNFDAFHRASVDVPPHGWVVDLARDLSEQGLAILVVTARSARFRPVTAFWLAMHDVPSDALYMRADNDYRADYLVKRDIYARLAASFTVVRAVDDNPQVVRLWQELGIATTVVPGWVEPSRSPKAPGGSIAERSPHRGRSAG